MIYRLLLVEKTTSRMPWSLVCEQLVVDQSTSPHLEVSRCHAHVVFTSWEVELGKAPVDEPQLPLLVVDHDVVRLDVTVHDALGVAVAERLRSE